jgi:membrane protease YdiL (CAAX protease family)
MIASHVALDHVLFAAIFVAWPLAEWLWYYPRSVRSIEAGVAGARARIYRNILIPEWGFTACVIVLWVARGRSWNALRLGSVTPLRLAMGLAVAAAVLVLLWVQRRALLARPEQLAQLRGKLGQVEILLPRSPGERQGFAMVSITAGICEELLFRGFLMWYFAGRGVVVAVAVSSLFFGFAHIYQGVPSVPRTGILGLVLCLIVLAAGSLWPAIIIHAAIDLNSGDLGFRALTGVRAESADAGGTAPS